MATQLTQEVSIIQTQNDNLLARSRSSIYFKEKQNFEQVICAIRFFNMRCS